MVAGDMWLTAGALVRPSSVLLAAALCASCGSATDPAPDIFTAALFGTREVPANGSAGVGTAQLSWHDDQLTYSVSASGLAAPPLFVQVHIGTAEQAGAVVFRFEPVAATGVIASGARTLAGDITYNTLTISRDSLRVLMRAGLTYVNVYTAAYPGGEIRGQLGVGVN